MCTGPAAQEACAGATRRRRRGSNSACLGGAGGGSGGVVATTSHKRVVGVERWLRFILTAADNGGRLSAGL